MPAGNPLVNGSPVQTRGAIPDQYPGGNATVRRDTGVQPPLRGEHNTAAQVGALVLIALGVLFLLQKSGFRFVVDAGIGAR
jgi:hypothetical protein